MAVTVTKKDLAYRIAERAGLKKVVVKQVLQEFIDDVIRELGQGNRLEFREFGVFEIKTRAARKARNPRTGARVDVPPKTVIHFKAGRMMKEMVAKLQAGAEPAGATVKKPVEARPTAGPGPERAMEAGAGA
jgi:integration host factor subunit beta